MARLHRTRRPLDRARRERRESLRGFWNDARWWVVLALFIVALVLGFVGFRSYLDEVGGPTGFWDVLYRTLQLYVLESGALEVSSAIPASLQVARLLAPAATLVFVNQAVWPLVRDQYHLARLRGSKGHVVVCGLGSRGLELARRLREDGYGVVAVERDADGTHVEAARVAGVRVLIGDATQPTTLRRVAAGRAGAIVAFCGDDAVNAEIGAVARSLATDGAEPLVGYIHVFDPELCSLLRARHLSVGGGTAFRFEFLNVFERAAAEVLVRHPPFRDYEPDGSTVAPHLLVVGLGWFGESLVVRAARTWSLTAGDDPAKLRVSVVDANAEAEVASLLLRHPEVGKICEVVPMTLDVRSSEFEHGDYLATTGADPVTAVYVCLADEVLSLQTALVLHNRFRGRGLSVVFRTRTGQGLAALLGRRADDDYEDLHAFALVERTCDPDLLLGGTTEFIARALHDVYVQSREAEGWRYGPVRDGERRVSPALASWNELDEEYRDSSRDQAAHVPVKLAAVGCELEESLGWHEAPFVFTDDELERLARMEHERFVEERRRRDWTLGADDPGRKTSASLVRWEELPFRLQEYDRQFVRELPVILAKVGYRIVRVRAPSGARD